MLFDCDSGMSLDFFIYVGKTTEIPQKDPVGVSGFGSCDPTAIAIPWRGHVLYTDNWDTSEDSCQYLRQHSTGFVGAVKAGLINMPELAEGSKSR